MYFNAKTLIFSAMLLKCRYDECCHKKCCCAECCGAYAIFFIYFISNILWCQILRIWIGAMTFSITTLSITVKIATLSITALEAGRLSVVMLSVVYAVSHN